jgi:hypothetical protein
MHPYSAKQLTLSTKKSHASSCVASKAIGLLLEIGI